jgi:hypothetical protein
MVAAYVDALAQVDEIHFDPSSHSFRSSGLLTRLLDATLLPMRGALRTSDVDLPSLSEGITLHPASLASYQYHLARHKNESACSFTKYAFPIEWITSAGSVMLLLVALYRVLAATPT